MARFALLCTLILLAVPQIGCLMPCGAVRDDADQRFEEMKRSRDRVRDPGGDRYDLTLHLPAALLESSFEALLASGEIPRTHRQRFDLPVPGAPEGLSVRFRVDLEGARLALVPGAPARVQAHLDLRLRGEAQRELFDLRATLDGPVELTTRKRPGEGPVVLMQMGDLRRSELALDGEFLGNSFSTVLEGLIPSGGLGSVLDAIGAPGGGLPPQVQEAVEDAARQQATALVGQLLEQEIGEVAVFEVQPLELAGLRLQPRAVDLATGDGWAAIGVRTDLHTGFGSLPLHPPGRGMGRKVELRVSEPFLDLALQRAYVDGVIPRTLDDAGAPADEGPYRIEPLGVALQEAAALDLRVYRCEEPCGWAELRTRLTPTVDAKKLVITAGEIEITRARGVGKVADLALQHHERVVGEPLQVVQSLSRAVRLDVGGQPLELTVDRVVTGDGALTLTMGHRVGGGGKGGKGGKGDRGSGREGRGTRGGRDDGGQDEKRSKTKGR